MDGENSPLFDTERAKGRKLHRVFATTVLVSIVWIWVYRATQQPPSTAVSGGRRWWWRGMFMAELWFGMYWVFTQSVRWNPTYRRTFKQRLSQRYEDQLPRVDIFVCTADPKVEPPMMVVSTVLSVMAYDYPPKKLAVYLSDDGGSELTFYALTQAAIFSKHWLPYCRNYKIEPRSPLAYFKSASRPSNTKQDQDYTNIKKLFEEMKDRTENVMNNGRVHDELRLEHKGFTEWDSFTSPKDHATIVQVLLDQNEDAEGHSLPKLVYLAREKRPDHFHNFKAGALNALVDFHGLDGNGGSMYIGTGCFHRRDILFGKRFDDESRIDWKMENDHKETLENMIEELKNLASCTYEIDTEWGKEMGLKYGCPVEDILTGLSIHCRGWKSVYYNPNRKAFLGVSTTTLDQTLVQHKRWSEGDLLVLISKYSPAWFRLGKVNPGLIMGYLIYCLWAPSSVPTLYYSIVPSVCLLKGVPLFPAVTSGWFLPFAYIIVSITAFDYLEFLRCGGTTKGWWNGRRISLYKRTSSYLFALLDIILGSDLSFVISSKVMDNDVQARYEKEMMEFGVSSPLTTTVATISMLNLVCFVGVVMKSTLMDKVTRGVYYETMAVHVVLCGALVVLNMPLYWALFVRKDKGKIPDPVTVKSVVLALFVSTVLYFM
ncbi:putative cellulose synthase (UDP-forming) [Helianthus annuus]|nr:putative cellulose synthase (UDP-forming) [Helianthus annuus]KAJ0723231.1 putative cellulose synthase (UDP-forming) [Helianthus annuus]